MVILKVESEAAARATHRDDPWVIQDVLVPADVKEWTILLDGRAKTLD